MMMMMTTTTRRTRRERGRGNLINVPQFNSDDILTTTDSHNMIIKNASHKHRHTQT